MAKNQNERAVIDLVINGQQAKTSLKEVSMSITKMRSELNKLKEEDNPALYQKKVEEINKVIRAQREMSARINDTTTAWGRFKKEMATVATGVLGGNAITFAVQTLVALIPQAIDKSMKLKDQLADIAKATDMTDQEVGELNQTLKTFNTRTATKDLRDMAVVAGQFGIAKDQIADFVQSADKLNVAIGDQFEGAEQTASTMLTLRNTFLDIKSDKIDQDMMHIGNALNVLEADGAATGAVMADFSSRIGGVAIPLGLSSGQVLGLSASLQEMNVTAERGSTAVNKLLSGMATSPATFAKYARAVDGGKLSSKQFTDLVNTDMMGALMAVVRGFQTGDTSATGMAKKMADMELTGEGVMEIFLKLASNTQLVEDKIKKAGEAITKTDSITGEFNKKNHELAVNMKLVGEWFSGFLSAGWLTQFGEGLAKITVLLLGLNRETGKLTSAYTQQREQVAGLDKQLKPLLDKHDQLKEKSKLSSKEQNELKTITQQIAKIMPGAVTGFDDYGQALSVSADKARDLLEVQRQLLKSMNKGAIAEQQGELRNLLYQQKEMAELRKSGVRFTLTDARNGTVEDHKLTDNELKKLDNDIENKKKQIADKLKQIAELEGKPIDKPKLTPKATPPVNAGKSEEDETEKERKARLAKERREAAAALRRQNKAKTEEDSYETLIARARQRTAQIEDDSFEKDQLRFGENYSKLYEKAKGNKARMTEITQLMYNELSAIQQKHEDKEFKKSKKNSEKLLEQAMQEAEAKKSAAVVGLAVSVGAGAMTPEAAKLRDLEAEALYIDQKELLYRTHYAALKELAGQNAENLNLIAVESKTKQSEIDKERTENEADQALARGAVRKSELDHVSELADKQKKLYEAERDFRQNLMGQLSTMLLNDWTQTLTGYKEFWQRATVVQKAALLATKAYALAEIGINLARQITMINTMATMMNTFLVGSGEAIRWIGIAKAVGNAAVQTATVISSAATGASGIKAFKDGGFSNPEGFTSRATMFAGSGGPFLAGEAGTEFIINNRALQQPVVANFARMLDSVQQSGNYASLATGMAGAGSSGGMAAAGASMGDQLLQQMLAELRMNRRELEANRMAMEDYASRPIMNNYLLSEQFAGNVQEMRQGNTL